MKIQGKLNLAIFSILFGFAAALGTIFYMNHIADSLKELELQSIRVTKNMFTLTDSTKAMIISNSLDLADLVRDFENAVKTFDDSILALRKHPANKYIAADLAEQIDRTQSVWAINTKQFQKAKDSVLGILNSNVVTGSQRKGLRFITESLTKEKRDQGEIFFALMSVQVTLEILDQSSKEFIVKDLTVLGNEIKSQAETTARRGQLLSLSISAVLFIVAAVFITIFSRGLAKRIRKIEDTMRVVSEKDLTIRTNLKARDEIGALSSHINSTLDILAAFFHEVKDAVDKMLILKDSLSSSSTQSASALNEITKNIESIRDQFIVLDRSIATTTGTMDKIAREVQELTGQIDEQTQSINNSSTAIEEMAASIGSVAKLSTERKERANSLLRIIHDGGEKVALTNDIIKSISKEIDDILEIIEIINNVSEQTNLLSMNAAIESAHAGEAGKGFAVVAEEIRKLAESTSENSSRIDTSLKSITEKIKEALDSSNSSHKNFEDINAEVKTFSAALDEIATNMDELSSGSNEILKASGVITETTHRIQEAASSMNRGTKDVQKAALESRNISAEVVGGMNEIEKGSKEILTAIVEMTKITETTRERMEDLHEKVETFKVGEDAGVSDDVTEIEELGETNENPR